MSSRGRSLRGRVKNKSIDEQRVRNARCGVVIGRAAAFFSVILLSLVVLGEETTGDEKSETGDAFAEDPRCASNETNTNGPSNNALEPIPIAITINRGVSLGAYEAGYLYYLTEFLCTINARAWGRTGFEERNRTFSARRR